MNFVYGALAGVSFAAGLAVLLELVHPMKHFPATENVNSWYVKPSELEISVEDLLENGERQTVLNYQGKDYLLMVDPNEIPFVTDFHVVPSETKVEYRQGRVVPQISPVGLGR